VSLPVRVAFPLPVTAWAIANLEPHEWLHVADYLDGQISRAPLTGNGWNAERIVLGAMSSELRQNAMEAGETVVEDPEEDRLAEHRIEDVTQALVASGHARDEAFLRDAAAARLDAMYAEHETPAESTQPAAADESWFD
jgi:hypothetical protein